MKNSVWAKAAKSSPDPERASRAFELFCETSVGSKLDNLSPEFARVLSVLFAGSSALGNLLIAHPDWLELLEPDRLQFPRREQGLRKDLDRSISNLLQQGDFAATLSGVRIFKQREMLRIGARDLARFGDVPVITRELSDIADVCLHAVWDICLKQFHSRYGEPWHLDSDGDWQRTHASVLGMGKLGGQELNYSSDVDVLFVYSEEGSVFKSPPGDSGKSGRPVMANHQFFNRVAEAFIAEVSRLTDAGSLFRIDLRLRPEGDSGPLCRSLGSYENYYAQWGQTWERMMLIKARSVAGSAALAAEFLETIQPFRYPRSVGADVLEEIGAMKNRIENEVVKAGELERNVKLGRGGIREIEFIVQSQQLLHAGKQPFLQGSQTLPLLEKLAQYRVIEQSDANGLADAYRFLRDVEHRLQMDENLQTHTIPTSRNARERLARTMGFANYAKFESARRGHTETVRAVFDRILKIDAPTERGRYPVEFAGAETEWKRLLENHAFRDPDKAFDVLRQLVEGPGYVHVSTRTVGLALKLLPRLFALCPSTESKDASKKRVRPPAAKINTTTIPTAAPRLSDPDRVITRLESFIEAYGARPVLFELWNSNPAIFELLILLFDRSEFLAELAIRTPDLVDELVTSGRLRQRKTSDETLRDLLHGLDDADQKLWLRRYHQTELMRIGLRDILGLADPEQYLTELSALADACLKYALAVATRKLKLSKIPLAIIGLGKLGGSEIDYGSDLDIIFVASDRAKNFQKLQSTALEVMDLLSARTELGLLFHTDARLRPDGEKGLLVNTLSAYEQYYRQRAELWELQSITRARPVAGDEDVGAGFQKLAGRLTDFAHPDLPIAGYSSDWKQQIHRMRMRIEKERTPGGQDDLAIKTGRGGLIDAEFVAQAMAMEQGWRDANTLRILERVRDERLLKGAETLIVNYRKLRRVEGILRRWSYEGETVLPAEPEPYHRVSVRCGFESPDSFREALAEWRAQIRRIYNSYFSC